MNDKIDIKIVFPGSMEYVPPVREFVRETLYCKNYSEKEAFRTEVMIDELISNSVIYGSNSINDKVSLDIAFDEESFECTVEDFGVNAAHKDRLRRVYDSITNEGKSDEIKKGLSLVKLIADDISLDVNKNGETEIKVVKYKTAKEKGESNE